MFSEKIDYERLRRLLLQNLEELHSEVYKIREEVSQIHQWNAVMFRFLYNQKFDEFDKSKKKSAKSKKIKKGFNEVMEDMEAWDKGINKIISDAKNIVNKNWREKLDIYKSNI